MRKFKNLSCDKYPVGWENERRGIVIYNPDSSSSVGFAPFFHTVSNSW